MSPLCESFGWGESVPAGRIKTPPIKLIFPSPTMLMNFQSERSGEAILLYCDLNVVFVSGRWQ